MDLINACKNNDIEKVKQLIQGDYPYNLTNNCSCLSANKIDINQQDNEGGTALMWASYYNFTEIVQLLIDNFKDKIDINQQGQYKNTALIYASNNGHTQIVQLLTSYNRNQLLYKLYHVDVFHIFNTSINKINISTSQEIREKTGGHNLLYVYISDYCV